VLDAGISEGIMEIDDSLIAGDVQFKEVFFLKLLIKGFK